MKERSSVCPFSSRSGRERARAGAKIGAKLGASFGSKAGPFASGLASGLGGATGYLAGAVVDDIEVLADGDTLATDGGRSPEADDNAPDDTAAVTVPVTEAER